VFHAEQEVMEVKEEEPLVAAVTILLMLFTMFILMLELVLMVELMLLVDPVVWEKKEPTVMMVS
jgi:hypothetical protein